MEAPVKVATIIRTSYYNHELKSHHHHDCACSLYRVAGAICFCPQKVNGSGNEAADYFTAVIFSDPHVDQTDHDGADASTFSAYCETILNLGKSENGGKRYQFNALPGYTPKADIVFCLGDMDQDNEKSGASFKAAFHKLNAAGIPFITMLGNHDVVPDYWTGDNPDEGLTWGGVRPMEGEVAATMWP